MFKKICPTMVSLCALFGVHGAQGMDTKKTLDLKKSWVMDELSSTLSDMKGLKKTLKQKSQISIQERQVILQERRAELAEKKRKLEEEKKRNSIYRSNFNVVMSELEHYNAEYTFEKHRSMMQELAALDRERYDVLYALFLADIEKEFVEWKAEEEVKGAVFSEEDIFEVPASFAQEEDQEQVFTNLMSSLIIAEKSQIILEATQATDAKEVVAPVTVGWFTWLSDKLGFSNLAKELEDGQMSLETLQKSSDMQTRINDMLASYSPSKKKNPAGVKYLLDIYTQLDKLNFKFVNADVNSDIYNATSKWLAEEEVQYAVNRKAHVLAISKLLITELQKMIKEETPRAETIMQLEELQRLSSRTGMVAVDGEEKTTSISEPKVFDIVCHLEALSEELLKEEAAK